MKRCPQCEFIYEDDQSLCDMDGVLLVLDARTLPNLHALATVEVPVATTRPHWKHRTFPAMAALILATVLSLVYFVTTSQRGVNSAVAPAAGDPSITAPISNAPEAAVSNPEPTPTTVENRAATTVEDEPKPKPEPTKAVNTPPAAKKTSGKTPTTQNRTEEPRKDDSKVNNILKKTGRILKKPFKF